jgi:outer membrane protein OmpA-like peptidoglycan-associated protein/tetratricopeptide (TPR) repeat protein
MMSRFIKITIVLFIFLLLANVSYSQKITVRLADQAFKDFSWLEAIDLYTYAHERDKKNTYIIRRLADCFRNIGRTEDAENWLKMLVEYNEQTPEDLFHLSMALKSNGKYSESEEVLREYATMRPEDGRINLQQSLLDYIDFLLKDSVRYEVEPLPFNTKGSDWGPVVFENRLIYVSTGDPDDSREIKYNWDNLPFLDLYSVTIDDYGNYSKPEMYAKNLMTSFHEGPATFDMKNKRMYFNSNRTTKTSGGRRDEENNLQIFYADWENGQWALKGEFKHNDRRYNMRHPSVDVSGELLFFASDMPGGKGGNDIYWCRMENGEWGHPVNLEEINTEGDELFPFIAPDGVLYFSSNGLGGMGRLDIYMALPDRGVYSQVENLGYPVNSPRDDFGIWLDDVGMSGYFSSDRPGGKGFDDIYKIEILYIPVQIRGTVRDKINMFEISGAQVALLDENMDTVAVTYSKEDGEFLFAAFKQRNYRLSVNKDEFYPAEKDISTYNKLPNEKIEVEVFIEMNFDLMEEPDDLEPLSMEMVGGSELQIIQIEHINYGFDSDKILPDAAFIMDKVVTLVKQYTDLEVRVESHTDAKGSDEYNLRLSKMRATSAFKYLVSKGIDPLKIEYSGFGETQLLNHCDDSEECTDEEHAINRRSIIKVVRRGKYKTGRTSRSMFYF